MVPALAVQVTFWLKPPVPVTTPLQEVSWPV
jgi:hypothetical protein